LRLGLNIIQYIQPSHSRSPSLKWRSAAVVTAALFNGRAACRTCSRLDCRCNERLKSRLTTNVEWLRPILGDELCDWVSQWVEDHRCATCSARPPNEMLRHGNPRSSSGTTLPPTICRPKRSRYVLCQIISGLGYPANRAMYG
jgi:hypothetical protein